MGKYPHGWETATLGELCNPNTGLQTGPFGSQLHASDYTEIGVPVVMPKDIVNYRVSTSDIARIPETTALELSRHRLLPGDIVFARRGDIGRCALITRNEQGWLCGTGCLRSRIDNKAALPEYLIFYLDTPEVKTWLETNAVGQTMLNLNTSILAELPICLPPLPEQRKIAAILSTWDEAITLTEQLIAALTRRKQALMQLLLTGAVRFPEFEGEWQEVELADIAEVIMGQSPPSEGYNSDGVGLPLIQGNADIKARKTAPRSFTSIITKRCQIDDTILSVRAPVGEVARSLYEACIGRGVAAIRATKSNPDFLYQLMVFTEQAWQQFAQGSTFTAVNSTDIKAFALEVPTLVEEQVQIADLLNVCDVEIEHLEGLRDYLHMQKRGLMQQLLTGAVRVRVGE